MIWIATLCLLAIAAWLIFNGINERRWVQAHSHDETVAADEGFLPNFSSTIAKRRAEGEGKLSIKDENTRFARAVNKVQERTAKVGEKIEARAQRARVDDEQRPASAADESDFFGKSVRRIKSVTAPLDSKLDERMRRERMKGEEAPAGRSITEEGGLFGKAVAKVSERTGAVGQRMADKAKAAVTGERVSLADEDSWFARTVKAVSGKTAQIEERLDAKASGAIDAEDDFMMRQSKRIGARINDIDEKIVASGREIQQKLERD